MIFFRVTITVRWRILGFPWIDGGNPAREEYPECLDVELEGGGESAVVWIFHHLLCLMLVLWVLIRLCQILDLLLNLQLFMCRGKK